MTEHMNRRYFSVTVRADASSRIGWGRAMRCLALACELRRRGARVSFVSKPLDGCLHELAGRLSFGCELLDDNLDELQDTSATIEAGLRQAAQLLIVDHDGLGPKSWSEFRRAGLRLAVIDDTALHPAIGADLILNQNVGVTAERYCDSPTSVKLCGSRYVLLRDAVRAAWSNRLFRLPATHLLITLGGADSANVTCAVLEEALALANWERVFVAAGPSLADADSLQELAAADSRVQIVREPFHLPMLMAQSDVAVTAGDSTCYECAYLGLPSVIVQTADDQSVVRRGLVEAGCSLFAGEAARLEPGSVRRALRQIADKPRMKSQMARRGRAVVDGRGTERAAAELTRLMPADAESRAA